MTQPFHSVFRDHSLPTSIECDMYGLCIEQSLQHPFNGTTPIHVWFVPKENLVCQQLIRNKDY